MTTGGMQHRNEEGVVNAVVFAGCSSSKASANKLFQWELQHELWRVLCRCCICVLNSSELMVVGNAT